MHVSHQVSKNSTHLQVMCHCCFISSIVFSLNIFYCLIVIAKGLATSSHNISYSIMQKDF